MSVLESAISPLRHRVAAWPVEKSIPQLSTKANGATLDPGIAMQVYKDVHGEDRQPITLIPASTLA